VFRAQKLLDALVAATPAPAPKKTFNYTCNSMEDRVIHNLLEHGGSTRHTRVTPRQTRWNKLVVLENKKFANGTRRR
jgi:hypothetical protein